MEGATSYATVTDETYTTTIFGFAQNTWDNQLGKTHDRIYQKKVRTFSDLSVYNYSSCDNLQYI